MLSDFTWVIDELQSAGRENLDLDHVHRYDKKEDSDALEELSFLKEFGLNKESEIVEIGAGTGQFTLAASSECARVISVDISPVMLEFLQEKLINSDVSNVEVVQAGFLSYEHIGRKADIVYSRYALHHLPDFWKVMALKKIRNILRPGGIFRLWDIIYNFDPSESETRLEGWCSSLGQNVENVWTRPELEEHIRDEHSTFTWLIEPMLKRTGFEIENIEYSSDGFFARYVARVV